jgi:hypothetical protein
MTLIQMNAGVQFDDKAVCDVCGKFGAFEFDGQKLCAECYESHGSCCPEFGREDSAKVNAKCDDPEKP